jgi:hypothetical protein
MTEDLESLQVQLQKAAHKSQESSEQISALVQELPTKIIQLKLLVEGSKVHTSVKILESLRYESMNARESEVKDEHAETFRWILEHDRGNDPDSPRFMEWLESGWYLLGCREGRVRQIDLDEIPLASFNYTCSSSILGQKSQTSDCKSLLLECWKQ